MEKTLKELIEEQFSEEQYTKSDYNPNDKKGLDGRYKEAFKQYLMQLRWIKLRGIPETKYISLDDALEGLNR